MNVFNARDLTHLRLGCQYIATNKCVTALHSRGWSFIKIPCKLIDIQNIEVLSTHIGSSRRVEDCRCQTECLHCKITGWTYFGRPTRRHSTSFLSDTYPGPRPDHGLSS